SPSAVAGTGHFSRDGTRVITGQPDAVFDVLTGEGRRTLTIPGGRPSRPDFSTEGDKLVHFTLGGTTAYIWDAAGGPATVLEGSGPGQVFTDVVSPDGRYLLGASRNGVAPGSAASLEVWDLSERRVARRIDPWPDSVFAIAFSPDGRWLAAPHDLNAR